jgi:signal transduction histidine kinase
MHVASVKSNWYNAAMNTSRIIQQRPAPLFDLAVYLTLAVLAVVSLLIFSNALVRGMSVALCLAFGLIYRYSYYAIRTLRQATIYFGVQTLVLTGLVVLARTSDVFGLLFFTLGIQAVLTWPTRRAIVWVVLFYLIDSGGALLYRGPEGIVNVLFNAAVFVLTFVFANSLRQTEIARDQNQQLLEELRAAQRQVQDLAVAEERNRLARELHDSVKQQVFASIMQLGAARVLLERDPSAARLHLLEAEQLAQQSGAELSLLIHELRPVALGEKGLAAAIQAYAADWSRQTKIATDVRARGTGALAPAAEHALVRVTQEALANVARHSHASNVTLDLDLAADTATLTIADNGCGFDASTTSRGVGLDSMRERLEALGGWMRVESAPGVGTTIKAHYEVAHD